MKPIFEEERSFFEKHTGILLPTDCWKNGSNIYLDPYCSKPLYIYKAEKGEIKIKKDNSALFAGYHQIKLDGVISRERERVTELFNSSVGWVKEYFSKEENKGIKVIVSYSGGKDSDVLKCMMDASGVDYILNFANTSNDTADTYNHWNEAKSTAPHWHCMNPEEGFYAWIKRKNYFTPTVLVRNCCSTFKEGQLTKHYNKNEPLISVTGVRKLESFKRSKYEKVMDHNFRKHLHGTDRMPAKWVIVAPIVNWSDLDIWIYLLNNNIKFHKGYRYGYERCGCLICPYASSYDDMLTKEYYTFQWERWINDILPKSYVNSQIELRQKWTFEEYADGCWKLGKSKEYDIISSKPTPEKIKMLAEIKGIHEDVAKKFFKRECCFCNKKLAPIEVSMNLKMYGRSIKIDKMRCKNCMCKELGWTIKQFRDKARNFQDGGCNLF